MKNKQKELTRRGAAGLAKTTQGKAKVIKSKKVYDRMRTIPDDRDICENCGEEATIHTDDGADFCHWCSEENITYCFNCDKQMAYTVSIYHGSDGNYRCQLCDQEYENGELDR